MTTMLLNKNIGLREALHCRVKCERFELGGLQEETNKNDSGCQARQVRGS